MRVVILLTVICLVGCKGSNKETIDLAGEWTFQMDPHEVGVDEAWYQTGFGETVCLPGSMNTNGKGYDVDVNTSWTGSMWNRNWYENETYAKYREGDDTKIVFWLQPDKHYTGVAWYQKEINIPKGWQDKVIQLSLERCHWVTEVWIDGKAMGTNNSLSTPHCYILKDLEPGRHALTLRIDNKVREINPGADAHSVSDNTQSNWNGVVGNIMLEAFPKVYIEQTKIVPDPDSKQTNVIAKIYNSTSSQQEVEFLFQGKSLEQVSGKMTLKPGQNQLVATIPWGEQLAYWDEFSPDLYDLQVSIRSKEGVHKQVEQYGVRKWETKGTRIYINDRPAFMRGTLECCIFPKTGYPPTQVEEWERIMQTCKEYGLNHIRFHSWCPPKAAFIAADRLGMYLQIECSVWTEVGSGKPVDAFMHEEAERIVEIYGNHPSFCFLASGNEPSGAQHVAFLSAFVDKWKEKDNRFLVTTAAAWPVYSGSDYHNLPQPRIQRWGEGVRSIINAQSPGSNYDWANLITDNKPTISHEIGQWCVYPNLREREKYTGAFKAKNFDIFEDRLKESGLLHLADDFLFASGKLQALCYKADIEAALRTDGFAGFQLLDLHDFPGQGSALVGVVDAFWEDKGYITGAEFREFCNDVVPLFRTPRFIYTDGEVLTGSIEIAQFSPEDIANGVVEWSLTNKATKEEVAKEQLTVKEIPTGRLTQVGELNLPLKVEAPQQYELLITINNKYKNRWDIWAYPQTAPEVPENILISSKLDPPTIRSLQEGANVLLSPSFGTLRNEGTDSVVVGFSSIFWNTLWTNNQAPHTLGILCDPQHPALQSFPTESYSNYQWRDAMGHCNAIPLHKLGKDIQPIVRIIDDWFTARSLGMIVELKIGNGKLLLCSADLLTNMDNRPEARQLYSSLVNYMKSSDFNPTAETTIEQLKSLFR